MRWITLYIATSIDGYIATPDGGVEWLDEISNPNKTDHGYNDLLDSIDTVLMGGRTYHEIIGFGVEWPYKNKVTYVVSRRNSNVTGLPNFICRKSLEVQHFVRDLEGCGTFRFSSFD